MKLTKAQQMHIEDIWKNYKEYKNKKDFRYWVVVEKPKKDNNIGGGRSSNISDTTAQRVIDLSKDMQYQYLKSIVGAVEYVYNSLDDYTKEIVSCRYWNEFGVLEWADMKDEFNISRSKAFRIREIIINKTAKKLGWL